MTTSPFCYRGIVEGYYGRPYTKTEREWLIDRMAEWGMNTYVYAPKNDPLNREEWRTPYPDDALERFADLVTHGRERGVSVGFALAPGLSIEYSSPSDQRILQSKFDAFAALGARFFCLALDDVPSQLVHSSDRTGFDSLAAAHIALAHSIKGRLPDEATLWLVPTDYAGTRDSAYLRTLGAGLDPTIEVGWTGRSVVSPEIRIQEAVARAGCLGRRLLVWDNFPASDGPMRNLLHLGPYTGRAPDLAEHLSGFLLNPMELTHASTISLRTAATYMRDPGTYDPECAWSDAVHDLGAGAADSFATFAAAHRFSALAPLDRDIELETHWLTTRDAIETGTRPDASAALTALRRQLETRISVAATIRLELRDRTLALEIEPWLESHEIETRIMWEATDLLEPLIEGAQAMKIALAFFRMEGRLTRIPRAPRVSYGPRRSVYPQLESLEDEDAHASSDPILFLDQCLTEEIVRFAESRALERLGGQSIRSTLHG